MTNGSLALCLTVLAAGVCGPTPAGATPARAARAAGSAEEPLTRARALARQKRWGEAVAALEPALAFAPGDARLLSELGWAAFQAGDHRKARANLEQSVARAADPRVKAASLYSLGRVEEAAGRRDRAARRYRASLALRPSHTVEGQLLALEDEEPDRLPLARTGEAPFCAEPRGLEEVCACVLPRVFTEREDVEAGNCALLPEPGVGPYRALAARGELGIVGSVLLVEQRQGGWVAHGVIDAGTNASDYWLEGVSAETVGPDRRALRFTTRWQGHHESIGSKNGWDHERQTETYFVTDAQGAAPRCALRVAVEERDEQYSFGDDPTREVDETTLRVDLGDDGIAQVVLMQGPAPDQEGLLGLHRLW